MKRITQYFSTIASNETMINARFLKNEKLFLKNKGYIENKKTIFIDDEEIITSDMILAERYIKKYMSNPEPFSDFKLPKYQFALN